MSLEQYNQDFITMIEAGFIAVNQSDEDSAVKLFKAAALLNPSSFLPQLGKGYIHLCKLELKQAVTVFNQILEIEPHNEIAKVLLGLCHSLSPQEADKGTAILKEAEKTSSDPSVKTLTENAIAFVEKFVKKTPTPAQGAQKK